MGQYYKLYDVDKKACIDARGFGEGVKLMESCYVGSPFVNALSLLLAGDWLGDRVVYVGDYAWDDAMEDVESACPHGSAREALRRLRDGGEIETNPYGAPCWLEGGALRELARKAAEASDDDPCLRFVANLDKCVYYDRQEMPASWEWVDDATGEAGATRQDPLLIFLAAGNGLGGGDYHAEQARERAGEWAGDRIAVMSKPPERFEKIGSPFDPRA